MKNEGWSMKVEINHLHTSHRKHDEDGSRVTLVRGGNPKERRIYSPSSLINNWMYFLTRSCQFGTFFNASLSSGVNRMPTKDFNALGRLVVNPSVLPFLK